MPRILVVEDDPDVRLFLQHALLDAGYDLDVAENVKGGEAFLRGRPYDLLLTDGRLPDGIGMTLADAAEEKGIPALILTGYAFVLRELAGADPGKYHVLLKPMRADEIIAAIANALAQRSRDLNPAVPA